MLLFIAHSAVKLMVVMQQTSGGVRRVLEMGVCVQMNPLLNTSCNPWQEQCAHSLTSVTNAVTHPVVRYYASQIHIFGEMAQLVKYGDLSSMPRTPVKIDMVGGG